MLQTLHRTCGHFVIFVTKWCLKSIGFRYSTCIKSALTLGGQQLSGCLGGVSQHPWPERGTARSLRPGPEPGSALLAVALPAPCAGGRAGCRRAGARCGSGSASSFLLGRGTGRLPGRSLCPGLVPTRGVGAECPRWSEPLWLPDPAARSRLLGDPSACWARGWAGQKEPAIAEKCNTLLRVALTVP